MQQYEKGVVFRFGRVVGEKNPGLVIIMPFVNVLRKVCSQRPTRSTSISKRSSISRLRTGVCSVTLVELKDIQLPGTMKRAMARQAEAEREKRAKINKRSRGERSLRMSSILRGARI